MIILDFDKFKEGFQFLQFSFNIPDNKVYTIGIYNAINKDITDELFLKRCFELSAEYTKQEFFKEYGVNPTIKDFVKMLLPEKKERYREVPMALSTKYKMKQVYFGYPDEYQKQIDNAISKLNINCQPLESEETILNKKKIQTYIGAFNTNLKSK
jgi:hypothetical protein